MRPMVLALLLTAALSPLAPTPASATLIADASFETVRVPIGGFQYDATGSAWTFASSSGLSSNGGPFYAGAAPDGTQAAFIQSAVANGGITYIGQVGQTVTGLTVGTTYTLFFSMAARAAGLGNPIDIQFAGVDLGTFTPSTTDFVQQAALPFVARSTSGLLSFTGAYSVADITTDIDALTLLPALHSTVSDAAVPEPASLLLLAAGLGTAISLRRKTA